MSPALRTAVKAVAEGQWEPYGKPDTEVIRECADVLFVPNEHSEQKDLQPLRYVAVRIRRRQGGLLEEAGGGPAFCGADEHSGLEGVAFAGVAPGEGRHD